MNHHEPLRGDDNEKMEEEENGKIPFVRRWVRRRSLHAWPCKRTWAAIRRGRGDRDPGTNGLIDTEAINWTAWCPTVVMTKAYDGIACEATLK